jgi:hypothetical protein
MAEQNKKRPVHEVRIGLVKAAVWRNEGSSGAWHSVSFERIYKDGDDWKSTSSFGRDDLLVLAKVADLAHTWIIEHDPQAET